MGLLRRARRPFPRYPPYRHAGNHHRGPHRLSPGPFGSSPHDINIREATNLGLVGAGGIGRALSASIGTLAWSQVGLIFVAILATVVLSEWISARARSAVT